MVDPERLIASSQQVYGPARFRQLYGDVLPVERARVREIEDGEVVKLSGRALEFRHTRGHANHHFCIWDETSRGWFSGDMFGISYPWFRFTDSDFLIPATTPTQFDPQAYLASLELLGSYRPQRVYLTHYGEFAYSSESAALLGRQVARYAELALQLQDDTDVIEQALSDYSLGLLRNFDSVTAQEKLRDLLAFDMGLNAQGLQVWLQRRQ